MLAYQSLVFYQFYYIYIRFLFIKSIFYLNFNNFEIIYKKNWLKKNLILLIIYI